MGQIGDDVSGNQAGRPERGAVGLVAVDIDGTLKPARAQVSDANVSALARAAEAGIVVCLCTGRSLTETLPVKQQLPFVHPLVVANGAMVYDLADERVIATREMGQQVAREAVAWLAAMGRTVVVLNDVMRSG